MSTVVPLFAVTSHITGLDWLMIALYFGLLLGVRLVGRPQEQGHRRRLLPGRAATSAGGSSAPRSSRRTSAPSTSSGWPAPAPPTAWRWPTTSCTPGACWCWRGCSCRSTCGRWSSRCRSSWSAGSREGSRYVLSIVSLITFVISKIAVGIFAGGVVFGTLAARAAAARSAPWQVDSFWIGSVLVIVADRPLHHARRHARGRLQRRGAGRIVLIIGSASFTFYGLNLLGGWGELRAHLRLRHVQPVEAADPSGCRRHLGAGARDRRRRPGHPPGVVLQRQFPVARACSSARRSSASGTGAPTSTSCSARSAHRTRQWPGAGSIFAAFLKLLPGVPVHHPGPDLLRAGQERQGAGARGHDRPGRPARSRDSRTGAFPMMVQYLLPPGFAASSWPGLLSALMGSLAGVFNACSTLFTVDLYQKWRPQATQTQTGAHRPHRHRRHGGDRARLDPRDQGRRRASTTTCRRCRATWRRRSSWSSSSASSGSGSNAAGLRSGR